MGDEYIPNSHKFREEQEKKQTERKPISKVVRGKVTTKPKRGMSKLTDIFISEDAANVKSYIVMDVLVPAVKKAISDIVRDGIDMILYGESKGRKSNYNSSYVSYRDYSRRNDDIGRDSRTRTGYSHDDIILESRGEAEEVLTQMGELIDLYGSVSVADMYDLIGKTCEYTDNKYGWKNIRNSEAIRVRDGYMLKLPRAIPLNN